VTLEHAWPEWLLRALGLFPPKQSTGIMVAHFGPEERPETWRGAEITIKRVCKRCNSGWMSDLETEAKPLITPLLADLAIPLDRPIQRVIARWSIKTAMVFEFSPGKGWPSLFTAADRQIIADPHSARLPADIVVWIGRKAESDVTLAAARRLLHPIPIEPARGPSPIEEGYGTTFAFGRLVLQVLRVKRRENSAPGITTIHPRQGPWGQLLSQVWPSRRAVVQWPPPASFSEAGTTLDDLSERFATGPSRLS
jgi:hypothetical protein